MKLKHRFYAFGRRLKDSSPTFLCAVAIIGVVATATTAVKATSKAKKDVAIAEMKKGEPLNRAEQIIAMVPAYLPSMLIGTGTILCIAGSDILNRKQKASLASAYALMKGYHAAYRNKLIELHGKEADEEVRFALAREHCDFHALDLDTPDAKLIFYDEISGQTFERYEREVMDAEYHLNRNFVMRGTATLNEFYYFLGLPETDYGNVLGWTASDGYCWIDFEHKLITKDDGGADVYLIDMVFSPHEDFEDY